MTGAPTISLCMIVKDEEEVIAACLGSVASIISEAIVVDTGSRDRTMEIATSQGAKVFSFPWNNNFAAARNFSLSKAGGDWILVLDADEVIAQAQLDSLRSLTSDPSICTEFLQRHYTNDHRLSDFRPCRGEFPELERGHSGYFESNCVRLFPNGRGLEFRGIVHELVEPSIYEQPGLSIVRTAIRIHHYGHSDPVKKRKAKGLLYSPLGEEKVSKEPDNWKAYFELGVEHNVNGRKKESVEALRTAAALNPGHLHTWVNLGYALMELGAYKDAIDAFAQALKVDPGSSEAYCNLGVVGMRTGNLKLAEEASRKALALNPNYVNAALNLARTFSTVGRLSESVLVLQYVLTLVPQSSAALSDLGAVYIQGGLLAAGEKFLRSALAYDEHNGRAWFNLGVLLKNEGKTDEAKDALRKALSLDASIEAAEELKAFIAA